MNLKALEKRAQKQVDEFNAKYPVGTEMYLIDDEGQHHIVKTYEAACVVSCSAVAWARSETKNYRAYLIERFKPIT